MYPKLQALLLLGEFGLPVVTQTDFSLEKIYCNVNLTAHLSRCSCHGHATHHWHHGSTLNFQCFLQNRREHLPQESKDNADKEVQIKPFVTFSVFSETSHGKLL